MKLLSIIIALSFVSPALSQHESFDSDAVGAHDTAIVDKFGLFIGRPHLDVDNEATLLFTADGIAHRATANRDGFIQRDRVYSETQICESPFWIDGKGKSSTSLVDTWSIIVPKDDAATQFELHYSYPFTPDDFRIGRFRSFRDPGGECLVGDLEVETGIRLLNGGKLPWQPPFRVVNTSTFDGYYYD